MSELLDRRRFLSTAGTAGALASGFPGFAQAGRRTILEMARAAERIEGIDIVDVHAHIHYPAEEAIFPQDPAALVADMTRCGVQAAVFSHMAALGALSPGELTAAADDSAKAVRIYPSRLRSYLVFHPHQLETSKALRQRILEAGSPFVGFKLHGAFHSYPADGPNYVPAFEFAHQHKLPVLFHVGGGGRDWSYAIPRLAETYPGMSLILAHLAPGEEQLPALMKGRPNIFVDTCLTTGRHRQIERIVDKVGADRVLFATDAAFNSFVAGFGKLAFADLAEDQKKLIFGGNARRIFGAHLPAAQA